MFSMIPINLCMVQQALFTEVHPALKVMFVCAGLATYLVIFLVIWDAASVFKSVHASAKHISKLQWSMKSWFGHARIKVKLMSSFESISAPNLGFSIASLTVINFPIFYKVRKYFY